MGVWQCGAVAANKAADTEDQWLVWPGRVPLVAGQGGGSPGSPQLGGSHRVRRVGQTPVP